jgi:hypothetical protein
MDVTPGLRRDPAPDLESVGQDDELVARIHAEIARDGPLTFARFMDLPRRTAVQVEAAVAGKCPEEELVGNGWRLRRAHERSRLR